ncbi:hypothetical protein LOC67_19060 [Stieleria sp. JC731]|uniref:hypothetical protein n=1 Tax=Pirellulaceae TaxID=2691357 RepID=UPI001E4133FE|nr:hypothetical protein [Stieleria sp. JC731]MCC9602655.1 hypothetical protein [Stieleria sp. JC731]
MPAITLRINRLLDSHSISEDDVREIVELYEGELSVVNQKLGDAVDLVRRGLRSEAMAIIGSSPSLIDRANELAIPRLDELVELTELYDLPRISVVDTAAIELLGDAMVELQSIDGLLRRQRKLVLARAPLAWRLRTLRAIAAADSTSPHWFEDIEKHETARLKELSTDVQHAIQTNDLAKLTHLQNELNSTWQTDPPASLRSAVDRHLRELRLAEKKDELTFAATTMQECIEQFDEPGIHQAAVRFQKIRQEIVENFGSSSVPAKAEDLAAPGLKYVAELETEKQRIESRILAMSVLENTMDRRNASISQIESAYQKAVAFDEPLPPELFNRYRITIDDLRTRGKRKFQLAVCGVAIATLLLTGYLANWQMQRSHTERVATVAGQIQQFLDSGSLDEAKQFIETVKRTQPKLASDPKVAELIVLHDSMEQNEADRIARFDQQMVELESLDDEAIQPATLSRLEEQATTDDEKLRILKQRERYEKFVNNRRKGQTELLISQLRETGEIVTQQSKIDLNESSLDELRNQANRLDEAVSEINRIIADFPHASSSATQEGENQIRRITALKSRMKDKELTLIQSAGALEDLLAARSLPNLKSRMEDYISKLPLDQKSSVFKQTLDSAEFWKTADAWNSHIRKIQEAFARRFDPQSASTASQSGIDFSKACVEPPFSIPRPVHFCIEQAETRREILNQFESFLDRSLFSQIISITQKDGHGERVYIYKNFYDRERDRFSIGDNQKLLSRIEVIKTGDGAIGQETLDTPLLIELEPANSAATLKAKWNAKRSEAMADWDGTMLKWLAELCNRGELDATIKEILIAQAIEKIMKGSVAKEHFAKIHLSLVARRAAWDDWYRSAERSVQPTDFVVQDVMPALAQLYRRNPDPLKELKSIAQMRVRPIGIWDITSNSSLKKSGSNQVIHFWEPRESLRSGTLMVVRRDSEVPLKCRWVPIGEMINGQIKVTDSSFTLLAGEPIFISIRTESTLTNNASYSSHSLANISL